MQCYFEKALKEINSSQQKLLNRLLCKYKVDHSNIITYESCCCIYDCLRIIAKSDLVGRGNMFIMLDNISGKSRAAFQ